MDAFLAAIEGSALAQALRVSRWGYAAVNGAHILGIALLVGSIVPLNLRLLGIWPGVPREILVRVLAPAAAAGLALAVAAGLVLFSVKARTYAGNGFLQAKLVLVTVGTLSAMALHLAHGFTLKTASRNQLAGHAIVSISCWIGAVFCGRLIAFADG